jgi:hypothetical protein
VQAQLTLLLLLLLLPFWLFLLLLLPLLPLSALLHLPLILRLIQLLLLFLLPSRSLILTPALVSTYGQQYQQQTPGTEMLDQPRLGGYTGEG